MLGTGGTWVLNSIVNMLARFRVNPNVLTLIEKRRLHGLGLGWTDAHLLASTLVSNAKLWTLDKPLARCATSLGCAHA